MASYKKYNKKILSELKKEHYFWTLGLGEMLPPLIEGILFAYIEDNPKKKFGEILLDNICDSCLSEAPAEIETKILTHIYENAEVARTENPEITWRRISGSKL